MLENMAGEHDAVRASDFDREFVADRLGDALNDGRLNLSEYDDRVRAAFAARTRGELRSLVADLAEGDLLPVDDGGAEAIRAVESQRSAMFAGVAVLVLVAIIAVLIGQFASALRF
jgi:uncharacterized protein DUF1707